LPRLATPTSWRAQAIELLERQIEGLEHYPEMRAELEGPSNQTRGQQAAHEQTFDLLSSDPSALNATGADARRQLQGGPS
jgi:hypothetical protein